jgi:hypothetical protein
MGSDVAASIDFGKLGGPVYVGRPNGERARQKLDVDSLDQATETVDVYVPDDTYSINSSYFLGLFGPSVVYFGSEESFLQHYIFHARPAHMERIRAHVERALREQGILKLA